MTDPNNAQPPRHGVIKRTIGGSLARSWAPSLPRRRRCCVLLLLLFGLSACLLLLLLLLPIIVVLFSLLLCVSVETFVYPVYTYAGASSRELGNGMCRAIYYSLLLQLPLLRLLRMLLRTAAAAAAAAAAVCCYGLPKVDLPEVANNHYEV